MGNRRKGNNSKNNNKKEEFDPKNVVKFWDLPSIKMQLDAIQISINQLNAENEDVRNILNLIYEHLETISTHVDVLQREVYGESETIY